MSSVDVSRGRAIAVSLCCGPLVFRCINIHAFPSWSLPELRAFVGDVRGHMCSRDAGLCCVAGYFNAVVEDADRFQLATGRPSGAGVDTAARLWIDTFARWAELFQSSPTRADDFRTPGATASRIDRIYCNMTSSERLAWEVRVGVTWNVLAECTRISDHAPVVAENGALVPRASNLIPSWIAHDPEYAGFIGDYLPDHIVPHADTDVWQELETHKCALHWAAAQVRKFRRKVNSSHPIWQTPFPYPWPPGPVPRRPQASCFSTPMLH